MDACAVSLDAHIVRRACTYVETCTHIVLSASEGRLEDTNMLIVRALLFARAAAQLVHLHRLTNLELVLELRHGSRAPIRLLSQRRQCGLLHAYASLGSH